MFTISALTPSFLSAARKDELRAVWSDATIRLDEITVLVELRADVAIIESPPEPHAVLW